MTFHCSKKYNGNSKGNVSHWFLKSIALTQIGIIFNVSSYYMVDLWCHN